MSISNIRTGNQDLTLSGLTVISQTKEDIQTERIRLQVVNTDSTNIVRIGVGFTPTTTTGIPLYPGGSISWVKDSGQSIQQKQVLAIGSAGTPTINVYEEVI